MVLETIAIVVGISASTISILIGFWRMNEKQKQEIKDYVNQQINDPETGVRKCIGDTERKLEGRINEVKAVHSDFKQGWEKFQEGYIQHLLVEERKTVELGAVKTAVLNLQSWQTDELQNRARRTPTE